MSALGAYLLCTSTPGLVHDLSYCKGASQGVGGLPHSLLVLIPSFQAVGIFHPQAAAAVLLGP